VLRFPASLGKLAGRKACFDEMGRGKIVKAMLKPE
jgi:hypothetical protein